MSFVILIIAMAALGGGLVVTGIYLLLGTGSACIVAGVLALASAAFLTRGLTPRGG